MAGSRTRRARRERSGAVDMNAVVLAQHHYLAEFERVESALAGASLPWLRAQRREAIAAFVARGFPNARDEDWKYTRTAALEKRAFTFAHGGSAAIDATRVELARHPFAALNNAFAEDGVYLVLEKGAVLERPLQFVFIATAALDGRVTHPRIVVAAYEGSQVMLLERYVALDDVSYFTNAVTVLALGQNAQIEHVRLQEEVGKAFHISGVHVHQDNDSRYTSHAISLGGAWTRNDVDVQLAAPGVECGLNGLYMAGGRQHVDTHTRIDHLQPHGTSREFYKGVLDGFGRGVFNGKVLVHPDAQKTDARQGNQNLLLSDNAEADSKPELEIYADDVKCAHGATVGQLDADAVFYLRSRGMDEQAARSRLTYAFAGDIIDRIAIPTIRTHVQQALIARLPGGPQIKEFL